MTSYLNRHSSTNRVLGNNSAPTFFSLNFTGALYNFLDSYSLGEKTLSYENMAKIPAYLVKRKKSPMHISRKVPNPMRKNLNRNSCIFRGQFQHNRFALSRKKCSQAPFLPEFTGEKIPV